MTPGAENRKPSLIQQLLGVDFAPRDRWMVKQVVVFYLVGVVGFVIPFTHTLFIRLTPLILLMSLGVLLYYHRPKLDLKTGGYMLFVWLAGFFVEMWGVNSGLLFGSYLYGEGLGVKLVGTPLLIGVNWVLMVYLSSALFSRLPRTVMSGVVYPSLVMVGYDGVMELVAPMMDMWSFADGMVPMQNYVMWLVLSLLFHSIRFVFRIEWQNKMALPLFVVQTIFFLLILTIECLISYGKNFF